MADRPLKSLNFPGLADRYTIPQKTSDLENDAKFQTETQMNTALAEKADINGTYDNLIVGSAKAVLGEVILTDKVPYLYRTSGGSADVGNREEDTIVGGTVAWNQLWNKDNFRETATANGITFTNNGDGSITLNGTATATATFIFQTNAFSLVANHKYLFSTIGNEPNVFYGCDGTGFSITSDQKRIFNGTASGNVSYSYLRVTSGTTLSSKKVYPNITDLTQLFDSTMADYIYSLEQATAGSGVTFLKTHFPKMFGGYQPYDSGSIKSVERLESHEMVGFNQWDEEWENGYYNRNTGGKAGNSDTSYFRSKNYIPCLPNTTYHYVMPQIHASNNTYFAALYYDADKNYISARIISDLGLDDYNAVTPDNAHYITFYCEVGTTGATYKNDICINLSWSGTRNGEYEPYVKHSYPLDSSLTLRGIPKLDSANELYYDGDRYLPDGTIQRKYGVVDLGSLTWTYHAASGSVAYNYFQVTLTECINWVDNSNPANALCGKYVGVGSSQVAKTGYDKTFAFGGKTLFIADSSYSSASAFKEAMSGVMLVYELATPTTEQADPYQNPQIVDDWGTEEYVTSGVIPVGHVTEYMENVTKKVSNLPNDFSTLIAPTEKLYKATKNYSVGDYLIIKNQLYKVTSAITTGATIIPNTNVTATTIMAEIKALQ